MSLTRSTARNPPDRTGQRLPNAGEVAWIGVADRLFPRADGVLPDSTADVDKEYALFAHFIITGPEVPGVVTPSGMPGAIIEPLFLSNDGDAAVAARAEGKHAIVTAYEHAIVEYFRAVCPAATPRSMAPGSDKDAANGEVSNQGPCPSLRVMTKNGPYSDTWSAGALEGLAGPVSPLNNLGNAWPRWRRFERVSRCHRRNVAVGGAWYENTVL